MALANEITQIKSLLDFSTHFQQASFFYSFAVIFLLKLDNLASKSVFIIKLARASLVLKILAAKVLNSEAATYLS